MNSKYTKEELEIIEKYGMEMDALYEKEISLYVNGKRLDRLDLAKRRKDFMENKKTSSRKAGSHYMNCKWVG